MDEPNWKDLFYFSRRQRRGIAVLVGFILLIAISPALYDWLKGNDRETENYQEEIEELRANQIPVSSQEENLPEQNEPRQGVATPDINHQPFSTETVDTIPGRERNTQNQRPYSFPRNDTTTIFDVNKATANELAKLRGIGSVLSSRIVKFRDALGGFASIEQVGETYGVEPHVFERLKSQLTISTDSVQQHNLNTENAKQLSSHPYISEGLANQIVNYRNKVKAFETDEDVKSLYFVDEELFRKLKPYIVY